MNAKIYVPIEDSWDFFEDHRTRLKKELVEIASYDDTVVYMTESKDMPQLIVEIAGKEVENLSVLSSSELVVQLEKLYSDYILSLRAARTWTYQTTRQQIMIYGLIL